MRAKVVGILMMILAVTCILLGCFSTNTYAAYDTNSPLVPDKSEITAKVTEDGTFTLDTCKLTNEGSEKYTIDKSSVSIAEESSEIEGLEDSVITVEGFNGTLYTGNPKAEFAPQDLQNLEAGASTTLSFSISFPEGFDVEALFDKQVFTISLTPKEVINWIPMQAEIHDGTKIDFYPAFNEGDENVAKYKFAVKDGSTFNEITSVSSMSDIYNALQPESGTKTTTLYYQKTSSDAQALSCYTVKDLSWNYVFGATITTGEATEYSQGFIDDYQQDKSGNPNGIKTALLAIDDFGSDWNISTYGSDVIPKLANNVAYNNTGFYGCYGGSDGGLLSSYSYCPWGCCAGDSDDAFYFNVSYGEWDDDYRGDRSYGNGVVLARAFN